MPTPRLRLPASLTLTVFGLSIAGCSSTTPLPDADTDVIVADVGDVGVDVSTNCDAACAALFSAVNPECTPQPNADGTPGCVPAPDSGVPVAACTNVPMPTTTTGSCCCEVVV